MRLHFVVRLGAILGMATTAWANTIPQEVEPNNVSTEAQAITAPARIQGNNFPEVDHDLFSFQAQTGDKVYAATMTSFSGGLTSDSTLDLLGPNGTTVVEADDNNGSFTANASSIAGTVIPANGTYYLRVRHTLNSAGSVLIPYELYFDLRRGAPTPETENNNLNVGGQVLPPSHWVVGATSSSADTELFTFPLNAGDTVFFSVDIDPERDTAEWNPQIGIGNFGGFILAANDGGSAGSDSEALFMTVQQAGTYSVYIAAPAAVNTFGTYECSVTVFPGETPCTVYTSTDVPQAIPDLGLATSTITIPPGTLIGDVNVNLQLTHNLMSHLDAQLISPQGSVVGLFTDIGSSTAGSFTTMDLGLDDEAAITFSFQVTQGMVLKPESTYRLSWLDGVDAGGVWTLQLRDDTAGNTGTLTGWSLEICPSDFTPLGGDVVYSEDFESGAGGFTHSGVQDEWELGTPNFVPLVSANSGVNCWKTDLDNTYNSSSNQTLVSPPISLVGFGGSIELSWAQQYSIESAQFDRADVTVREVGGANPRVVWQHYGPTMNHAVGSPQVTFQESTPWVTQYADISDYAGASVEVLFHLSSDTTVVLTGWAVDDVAVSTVSVPLTATLADLATPEVNPGDPISYSLTVTGGSSTAEDVTLEVPLTNADLVSGSVEIQP